MKESLFNRKFSAFLGTLFFTLAAILTCLVFADRRTSIDISFPDIWYRSRNFHVLICVILYVVGWWAHRSAAKMQEAAEHVFQSVSIYSRPDCELCDRAKELLEEFVELPPIEVIDITGNPELEQQHATSIPVVEIDGKVRFRGLVSAELVQRLIDARQRQDTNPPADATSDTAEQGAS